MLRTTITWTLKAVAALVAAAAAIVAIGVILLALNIMIFHVPLSTR